MRSTCLSSCINRKCKNRMERFASNKRSSLFWRSQWRRKKFLWHCHLFPFLFLPTKLTARNKEDADHWNFVLLGTFQDIQTFGNFFKSLLQYLGSCLVYSNFGEVFILFQLFGNFFQSLFKHLAKFCQVYSNFCRTFQVIQTFRNFLKVYSNIWNFFV